MILIYDQGIVIGNHKCSQNSCIISILSLNNGKWNAFYSLRKSPLLLGTLCEFKLSLKEGVNTGYMSSVEIVKASEMSKLWNQPIVMSGFAVVCEAGRRFILDGIHSAITFASLTDILSSIRMDNLYESIIYWEKHLLTEYMDKAYPGNPGKDFASFIAHCNSTKCMDTQLRNDFIAMVKLHND